MEALAQLAYHTREHGGPEIAIVLLDGDHVEPHNVGRQKFAVAEIGRNKAQTLAGRVNAALGLKTVAVPQMATSDLLLEIAASTAQHCRVLLGAVDTTGASACCTRHSTSHSAGGFPATPCGSTVAIMNTVARSASATARSRNS